MMFKSAAEVVAYINSKHGPSDFDKTKAFFERHGNFQDNLKCLHIAGTNGKGSTVDYLTSILMAAGYQVGNYTSPHLEVLNDRIRINNEFITDADLLEIANHFYDDFIAGDFSFFELETIICFYYFYLRKVDYAVIEVGMGGRLDATNVLKKPIVTIITNIGYDHMAILGNTLAKIAFEKAGIIKPGVPVIIGCNMHPEAEQVIREISLQRHAPLIKAQQPSKVHSDADKLTLNYAGHDYTSKCIALYQSENIATALTAFEIFQKQEKLHVSYDIIEQGIANTFWLGRFEKMLDNPLTYVDGGHNIHAIEALCKTLELLVQEGHHIRIVFAALCDKETTKMLQRLLKTTSDITVTQFDYYRCKDAVSLAGDLPVQIKPDWKQAIKEARQNLPANGIVLIGGSLYFVSVARPYLLQLRGENHAQ